MSLIICDAGHTRHKIHQYLPQQIIRWILPNKPFHWPKELAKPQPDNEVLIMGTHPRLPVRLISHLRQLNYQQIYRLGVDLRVPLPHSIKGAGNDRLAGALGAQQIFPNKTCLIVSAGSAVTFDLISPKGYQGGAISAGLGAYKKAMMTINPALMIDRKDDTRITFPAKCTADAVYMGWSMPLQAAIEKQSEMVDQVIISGGDGELLGSDHVQSSYRPWLSADAMAMAMGANVDNPEAIHIDALN